MDTLGVGSTCKVKLAFDEAQQKVAIKFLHDDLSDHTRQLAC